MINDEKIVVISLSFASLLFARVNCYDLDEYQNEDGKIANLAEVRDIIKRKVERDGYSQCISDGGEGSTFSIDSPLYVKTCEGFSESKNGYIKILVGCIFVLEKRFQIGSKR